MGGHGSESGTDAPRRRALLPVLVASAILLLSAASMEAVAQLYILLFVTPTLEQLKTHEGHYIRRSDNPRLGYELQPGYERHVDGRYLKINSLGVRGDEISNRNALYRLALIGDSVTFGIGFTQDRTISSMMEENASCNEFQVVNLGVPGYGVQEIDEHLRLTTQSIPMNAVVYILNLNDFTLRDTIYEGADNGAYRMYNMPLFKTPLIVRKSWYRLMKGDSIATSAMKADTRWYHWLFDGTRDISLVTIRDMNLFARKNRIQFGVFILPAGSAYQSATYDLQEIHDRIIDYLTAHNVPVRDGVKVFVSAPETFFDETDHLFDRGNMAAAAAITDFVQAELGGPITCDATKNHPIRTTSSPLGSGTLIPAERRSGP